MSFAIDTDAAIAAKEGEVGFALAKVESAASSVRRSAGQRQSSKREYGRTVWFWEGSLNEAVATAHPSVVADYTARLDDAHRLGSELKALNALYTGWSRFFLVKNANGHIHRDMHCSTCFITTSFGWVTSLSGKTEAEAVAELGEILCSVCFPSAPVAWTTGVSKATTEAREAREAKKAEVAAKKAAKALGASIRTGHGRIETISAAKMFLTDAAEWSFPAHSAAEVTEVAAALAARLETSPEVEIAAAVKRAAKRG